MDNEELVVRKSNVVEYQTENIKNLIYTIRGKQVMLDSDVAMLYHYETKKVNQAVKRNIDRFPERFCFRLTKSEFNILRSQIVTSKIENDDKVEKRGGRRELPYVFTEQGIAMLSGILKSEVAIQVSIKIMDAFVEMRKFININKSLFEKVITIENKMDKKFIEHDKKFDEVFNELQKKQEKEFKEKIFFDGQIYDAYSLIIEIIKSAKSKILIIDNYIDDSILEMLTKKKEDVKVIILTSNKTNISKLDIQKFNKEYPILEVAKTDKFHDRFIVIDDKELYHVGASLKDLGKKCFAISKIEDTDYIEKFKKIFKNP